MRTIGIIGIGSMGGAIARGLLETGELRPEEMALCDREMERLEPFATRWPALACYDQPDLMAEECGMIILAVKPYVLADVVEACGESLEDKAVVSIAAGWTVQMLRKILERTGARWLRVMPNTPAMVGEGMTALCEDSSFTPKELSLARRVFNALGRTITLPERLFDGVTALSGSSPAYIYMLIEAGHPRGHPGSRRAGAGGPVRARHRAHGALLGQASGGAPGRGLLPRRHHDRRGRRPGGEGLPARGAGSRARLRGEIPADVQAESVIRRPAPPPPQGGSERAGLKSHSIFGGIP